MSIKPIYEVGPIRRCLREPIPEIFAAAELLQFAVEHHLAGDRTKATEFFKAADMKAVWDWTDSIWGKRRPEIHTIYEVGTSVPHLPREVRWPSRMPTPAEEKALTEHWGYNCAFCGIPLIHARIRKYAVKLYPEAVPWGGRTTLQHAAFMTMWMQFDHILPHARGGNNSFGNMLVTCAPCNFGRMNYTLEEMGLADPRDRPIIRTEWDGLERFR